MIFAWQQANNLSPPCCFASTLRNADTPRLWKRDSKKSKIDKLNLNFNCLIRGACLVYHCMHGTKTNKKMFWHAFLSLTSELAIQVLVTAGTCLRSSLRDGDPAGVRGRSASIKIQCPFKAASSDSFYWEVKSQWFSSLLLSENWKNR